MRLSFVLAAFLALAATPALADDAGANCATPGVLRPIIATHTMPPYPQMSVMTKEEGVTLLDVAIGADGVPTAATVHTSSGSVRLDEAAAAHVKENWRWVAPTLNCKPMAVTTRISVAWRLRDADASPLQPPTVVMNAKDFPPDALAKREQGSVVMTIYVLTSGEVALVRVLQSSGFPDLDEKSQQLVKTWHWAPASLDGHAVNTSLIVISQWKLPDAPGTGPQKP